MNSETKYNRDDKSHYSETDLMRTYSHNIRNLHVLNIEDLETINNFSYENRLVILKAFNDLVNCCACVVEDDPRK
jgi:hypothetical protein